MRTTIAAALLLLATDMYSNQQSSPFNNAPGYQHSAPPPEWRGGPGFAGRPGVEYRTYGNQTYGSDGSTCTRYGSQVFCR